MQRIEKEKLVQISKDLEKLSYKVSCSDNVLVCNFYDDFGMLLSDHSLLMWFAEIYWKAKMFDEMNQGYSVVDKSNGEKIGPYATQIEVGNALSLSPTVISKYYNGLTASRTFNFVREPYYDFETDCLYLGMKQADKIAEEKTLNEKD